jgi:hypothetical protein
MTAYTLHIEDTRYAVPTLHFLICATEEEARQSALGYLADSHHHLSAEVFLEGEKLISLSRADLIGAGK